MFLIKLSRQASKDKKKLKEAKLDAKAKALLNIIRINPYQSPPSYEQLIGNLQGNISRRINIQHRLIYDVRPNNEHIKDEKGQEYEGIIVVKRMWSHYE